MDKTAPTLELRDIHLPDDPSIWPLAFGWWLLIIIVSILIYVLVKKWQQLRKQKQLIDLMQIELNNINENFFIAINFMRIYQKNSNHNNLSLITPHKRQ